MLKISSMHYIYLCQHFSVAGNALLGYIQSQVPALTPEASLRLEFGDGLSDEESLATVYMLSTGLKFIWETRIQKKQVHLHMMRSEIEAQISLLRKSRHRY